MENRMEEKARGVGQGQEAVRGPVAPGSASQAALLLWAKLHKAPAGSDFNASTHPAQDSQCLLLLALCSLALPR